mmetsp:Transcript_1146/g.2700  ORF Transcript_1146/g.2700 Transcript_1146/m.2700 type:complete len:209 (+) Transcript_1146:493-1119(+)
MTVPLPIMPRPYIRRPPQCLVHSVARPSSRDPLSIITVSVRKYHGSPTIHFSGFPLSHVLAAADGQHRAFSLHERMVEGSLVQVAVAKDALAFALPMVFPPLSLVVQTIRKVVSFTTLLPSDPIAIVFITVHCNLHPLAMPHIHIELPSVCCFVGSQLLSSPVAPVHLPATSVLRAVWKDHHACTMPERSGKVSFIKTSISVRVTSLP